jgi:hypothetical protein
MFDKSKTGLRKIFFFNIFLGARLSSSQKWSKKIFRLLSVILYKNE